MSHVTFDLGRALKIHLTKNLYFFLKILKHKKKCLLGKPFLFQVFDCSSFHSSPAERRRLMNEIRAQLYALNFAHPINPAFAGRASFFNRNGFCLFRENEGYYRSPAVQALVQQLKTDFDRTPFGVLFNKGAARTRVNRARAERRQLLTKIFDDDDRDIYFDEEICRFLWHVEYNTLQYARGCCHRIPI